MEHTPLRAHAHRTSYRLMLSVIGITLCSTSPSIAFDETQTNQTNKIVESLRVLGSPIAVKLHQAFETNSNLSVDQVRIPLGEYREVYAAMEYQPLWVDDNGLTQRAENILTLLDQASDHGLNPSRYSIHTIRKRATQLSLVQDNNAQQLAELDLLLSHAITRYLKDVRYGATSPQRNLLADFRHARSDSMQLLSQAAITRNTEELIHKAGKHQDTYAALQSVLAQYRTIAASGGWEMFPAGKTIRPGASDKRIPMLRRILSVMGDYKGDTSTESTVYDDALQQAVIAFQLRHGLNGEGVIGSMTQKYLAVPVEDRITQIMVNLERVRWMPSDLGAKYVLVNLPAYTLTGYENGSKALQMRVIVGKPSTRTPIFSNVIDHVVFNPSWGAPQSIVRKELLPKLRENPSYFVNAGFTVYHNGEPVSPHAVDPDAGGTFSFRQRPGRANALGKIKFNLPDNDSIYLHSTAKPELFKSDMRALSHGCIRLEDPRAMAHFVMGSEPEWDAHTIDATYDSSKTQTVHVSEVPVHVVYWTAWVDENGTPHFFDDIYNRDRAVGTALIPKDDKNVKLAANRE